MINLVLTKLKTLKHLISKQYQQVSGSLCRVGCSIYKNMENHIIKTNKILDNQNLLLNEDILMHELQK